MAGFIAASPGSAGSVDGPARMSPPRITVLLATHNGSAWLQEQLHSIEQQREVQLRIVASDDGSRDDTQALLQQWHSPLVPLSLCPATHAMGSAGKNFYHLMAHAELGDAQYVALSDQDDVWDADKLHRAVQQLQQQGADAYSSNFYAWYPQRTGSAQRVLINKAQPQVAFDHLFQGPGPGCTFVLTRNYFEQWRTFLLTHWDAVQPVFFHDWLMYAHARSTGKIWHIDTWPSMLYRQHSSNVAGASRGWRAALKRLRMLRQGWLAQEVLQIAQLLHTEQTWPVQCLQRMRWRDRWQLALHVGQLRRSHRDRLALALACLFLLPRQS
jgi:rhamnosyltransferase